MEQEEYQTIWTIRIARLAEYLYPQTWTWNIGEPVSLNDISAAIKTGWAEEKEPYGDAYLHPPIGTKTTRWHIGRVVYFINHPDEIKEIDIDNEYDMGYIYPVPTILDGNHRWCAAMWLYMHGKLETISCAYGGRMDLLEYLTGETDVKPEEDDWI